MKITHSLKEVVRDEERPHDNYIHISYSPFQRQGL